MSLHIYKNVKKVLTMNFTKVLYCFFIWALDFYVHSAFINSSNEVVLNQYLLTNTEFFDCTENDILCREHKIKKKLKEKRIEEIKAAILKQLGISSPMNISNDERPSELTINMLKKHYGIKKLERKIDMEARTHDGKPIQTIKFSKLSAYNIFIYFQILYILTLRIKDINNKILIT